MRCRLRGRQESFGEPSAKKLWLNVSGFTHLKIRFRSYYKFLEADVRVLGDRSYDSKLVEMDFRRNHARGRCDAFRTAHRGCRGVRALRARLTRSAQPSWSTSPSGCRCGETRAAAATGPHGSARAVGRAAAEAKLGGAVLQGRSRFDASVVKLLKKQKQKSSTLGLYCCCPGLEGALH